MLLATERTCETFEALFINVFAGLMAYSPFDPCRRCRDWDLDGRSIMLKLGFTTLRALAMYVGKTHGRFIVKMMSRGVGLSDCIAMEVRFASE